MELPQSPTDTVLVVDDELVNIRLLQKKLEWEGLRVLTANSGEECLEIASSEQPELILLDVMMPGMDGLETCQALQENPDTKSIPVIFVTAQSSKQEKLEGLGVGAVDYISKPIDLEETTARVRSQLKYLAVNRENVELMRRLGESRRAASVGAITQGIAHNLNNLLGVVMGYIELGKANRADAEKTLGNLEKAENAGNRIVEIIKQLSSLAHASKDHLREKPLASLIAGSIRRAEEEVGQSYPVEILSNMDSISLNTNAETFESAVSKLIANAWESYGDNGERAREASISAQLNEAQNRVDFRIVDRGNGIAEEVRDNLFDPFISTKHTVGVGMGLTIARHGLRALGGEVYLAENEDGHGVSASFTHPTTLGKD